MHKEEKDDRESTPSADVSPATKSVTAAEAELHERKLEFTSTSQTFMIAVNGKQCAVPVQLSDSGRMQIEQWYSFLIDEIASELVLLSTSASPAETKTDGSAKEVVDSKNCAGQVEKLLHCELLQQRIRAIGPRLSAESQNVSRLEQLSDSLQAIRNGQSVSTLKLSDIKFEGQFVTKKPSKIGSSIPALAGAPVGSSMHKGSSSIHSLLADRDRSLPRWSQWETYPIRRYGCKADSNAIDVWRVIAQFSNADACEWIRKDAGNCCLELKQEGQYCKPLGVAASIGRAPLVKAFLDAHKHCDVTAVDGDGWNAGDYAVLGGWLRSYEHIASAGGKPLLDGQRLLYTCISKEYFNLAGSLVRDGFASLNKDMIANAPTSAGLQVHFTFLKKK